MKKLFEGSGVALVTPFKDGKVNYEKLGELIEWHIANKTDSISMWYNWRICNYDR